MLGFTIRKDEELEGFQIVTCNGITISMWGLGTSDDSAVQFNECAVVIGQPIPEFQDMMGACGAPEGFGLLASILGIRPMENITPMVMEKMGYTPSAKEIDSKIFITNVGKYFEIVEFVKKLGIQ